jgi:hypothetical protein
MTIADKKKAWYFKNPVRARLQRVHDQASKKKNLPVRASVTRAFKMQVSIKHGSVRCSLSSIVERCISTPDIARL